MFHNRSKTQIWMQNSDSIFDNAREYDSASLATYLSDKGIVHQTSCAHTPQQNGIVEHKNHHLLEVAQVLLFHMYVPNQF